MARAVDMADMFGGASAETFMGLPACADPMRLDHPVALIGAPGATPYKSVGSYCARGPQAIREAGACDTALLQHMDFDLGGPIFPGGDIAAADCGDLAHDEADAAGNRQRIGDAVRGALAQGAVPVVIGGDDSVPIPMIAALADKGPCTILQIDAHIDWRDEVQGERLGLSSTMRRASEMDHIEAIVQAGQRALGSARESDWRDAQAWGAQFFSAREIHKTGVSPVLEAIPEGANVIIALDWDALDPAIMPAVLGRAPGGLSYWQTLDLIAGVAAKANIVAVDLVEFVAERDIDQTGGLTAARVLVNVIGLLARQARAANA